MIKDSTRKKVEKAFRRIADEEGITYTEVLKIFRTQFLFAKEKIEGYDEEWLASTTEEELDKLVFNFVYIGKVYSSKKRQIYANNKKKRKDEK